MTQYRRDLSIDLFRGIVVIAMVTSHTIGFLGRETELIIRFIKISADNISYTSFLFIFGITLYNSLLLKTSTIQLDNKTKIRIFNLLITYYFIALLGIIRSLLQKFDMSLIFSVLGFIYFTNVSEFMLPYVLYLLITYYFKKIINKQSLNIRNKNIWLFSTIALGLSLFFLGRTIYFVTLNMNMPVIVKAYAALISGYTGFTRFPLLQYSIVLLLGIYTGSIMFSPNPSGRKNINNKIFIAFLISFVITIGILISNNIIRTKFVNDYERWPPSLLFLQIGITFSYGMLWVSKLQLKFDNSIAKILIYFGQRPINILVFHIFVLRLLELLGIPSSNDLSLLIAWVIVILGGYKIIETIYNATTRLDYINLGKKNT